MNQLRDWDGRCQRCYRPTDVHTMSMFDVALICMTCQKAEQQHPRYKEACDAERKAVKKGDRNFEGIGYSDPKIANDPVDW